MATNTNSLKELLMQFTTDHYASTTSDLHRSAVDGDVKLLNKCLNEEGVPLDLEDSIGNTPLYMAVQNNHYEVASILIKKGANVNPKKCVPLNITGSIEIANLLTESGADINAIDVYQEASIHRAVSRGNVDIVKHLIECGARMNQRNGEGMNSLHVACKSAYMKEMLDIIKVLVDNKCSTNAKDNLLRSPLHLACQNTESPEIIQLLIENGASLTDQDFKGLSPVYYFLDHFYMVDDENVNQFLSAISALVPYKDCANLPDISGKTPLHFAAEKTNEDVISLLLDKGSDPDILDGFGRIALHYCKTEEICQILIKRGSNVNIQDVWGQSPIQLAVERKALQIVECLAENDACIDQCDNHGRSIIHTAASVGFDEIFTLTFSKSVIINTIDLYKNTPLHLAAWNNHESTVQILLENEADPDLIDLNGDNPLSIAHCRASQSLIDILTKCTKTQPYRTMRQLKFSNYANELLALNDFEAMIETPGEINRSEPDLDRYIEVLMDTQTILSRGCQDELEEVQKAVVLFVSNLVDNIGVIDHRFRCKLLHVGSFSEGTKVRYQDEIDFTLCLERMSENVYIEYRGKDTMHGSEDVWTHIEQQRPEQGLVAIDKVVSVSGYALVYSKDKSVSQLVSEWANRNTDMLPCIQINNLFSQLLSKVVFEKGGYKHKRLIIYEVTLKPSLILKWKGSWFKDLMISVDLVPAIRLPSKPPSVNTNSVLITKDIGDISCLAVPKMTAGQNHELWRCSMVLYETAIFRKLQPKIRNSYILAKILIHSNVCPLVNFGDCEEEKFYYRTEMCLSDDEEDIEMYEAPEDLIPSYLLKMAFLTAIERKADKDGIQSVYAYDKTAVTFDDVLYRRENYSISYGSAETMFQFTQTHDVNKELVKDTFVILENSLRNKFVPAFFNPNQNVMNMDLLSGDVEKVLKIILYIQKILE